jgi:hypothetical protein
LLEQSLREANTQIEKLSVTDPLLGICKRRYLHERLAHEAARSRRYRQRLSLVMADLSSDTPGGGQSSVREQTRGPEPGHVWAQDSA